MSLLLIGANSLAISTAWFLAGYSVHGSFSSVPSLSREGASVSTRLFTQLYNDGAKVAIPMGLSSLGAFAYLAYALPAHRPLYAVAATLVFATLPLTRLVMYPGIQRLMYLSEPEQKAERTEAEAKGEILSLLETWKRQNWLRAAMFATSAVLGLGALQL